MSDEIGKVAHIGLGRMGAGIASNLLEAGFELTVYNRTQAKMKPLIEKGASGASSPREAATGADVILTCLMDDQSVLDMVTGENGLLAGLKSGGIHIGASTTSPRLAVKLAELHAAQGSHYVAGPVVGRPNMAAIGQLFTYVAGEPQVIAKCTPIFDAYTQSVTNLGKHHGLANTVKLLINYVVIAQVELMGEVFAFSEKSGIEPQTAVDIIDRYLGSPGVKKSYTRTILNRAFDDAGFELVGGFKDVQLMLQVSTDLRAPLDYASIIREKMITALAHGMERRDWSTFYEVTRMNAGLE
jgi:3-hydroxyisobutyrate dehydrogenase-like beta-hydroxyacid dehydrogenase